jgi:hypothetical protein
MDTDQFTQLLTVLIKIADKRQAITESVDWPLLMSCGSILILLIAAMWNDLKCSIKDHKIYDDTEHMRIWTAMKDCQDDCCPPRRRRDDT